MSRSLDGTQEKIIKRISDGSSRMCTVMANLYWCAGPEWLKVPSTFIIARFFADEIFLFIAYQQITSQIRH